MRHLRIALAAAVAASTSIVVLGVGSAQAENTNSASYWENQTDPPSTCVKLDPPGTQTPYGGLSDGGKAVVLNDIDDSWPGDHFSLLVVKAGDNTSGNAVYENPVPGQQYYAPLNNGGQAPAVSHWIVCFGDHPDPDPASVSWTVIDGTCASPDGSLSVQYSDAEVDYSGSPSGTYPFGSDVSGSFVAKDGFEITGEAGPFSHTFGLQDAPCDVAVVAGAPTFVDPTCASPGASVSGLEETEQVRYEVVEGSIAPGTFVKVQAFAKDGYVLDEQQPSMWSHTFGELAEDDCVVAANPVSSIETVCGAATFFFSNVIEEIPEGFTAESATFSYFVDGQETQVVVEPNGSLQVPVSFDEDSGVHTVRIGEGQAVDVETDCEDDIVTAAAPTFVDPTCADNSASMELPTVVGVTYSTSGPAEPGTTVEVTAAALPGFALVGTTSWSHDFPAIDELDCVEPAIDVAAFSPVCRADIPFVEYDIEVSGTDATTATLTFIALDGDEAGVYEDVPLSGSVVYPGASADPQDWPGWKQNNVGFWVPDPEDADWRDGLTVRIEVNPTATASVSYPDATSDCAGPEIEPPPTTVAEPPATIPPTTVAIGQAGPTVPQSELPRTGSDTTSGMVALGVLLVLAGVALIGATRRRAPISH